MIDQAYARGYCCLAKTSAADAGVFEGPVGDHWFHELHEGPPCQGWPMPRFRYRVKSYTVMQPEYGYAGRYPHRYQVLQRRRWWGWQTIDREEVPEYVSCYNAVGGSGWVSKFAKLGSFGRDGVFTPHRMETRR